MKLTPSIILATGILAAVPSLYAQTTVLAQDFDTSPVNYTLPAGSAFGNGATGSRAYWNLKNSVPAGEINGNLSGNATNYLTAQDLDNGLGFTNANPARIDFSIPAAGFSNFTLSLDLAGATAAEDTNYLRAFTDNDGDGTYETAVFNFIGGPNNITPYTNQLNNAQQLGLAFQNFAGYTLANPTGSNLLLRLEVFNDTASQNENVGIDNIVVSAVPEPTTALLALVGLAGLARRRRS